MQAIKTALAVALVPVYFTILAIGPGDDPSLELSVIFTLIVTALFSLALLRLSGWPWWIPPLVVGSVYFVGHYPLAHFTAHLQASNNVDQDQWFRGRTVVVVGPIIPVAVACIVGWGYARKRRPVD